MAYGASVLITSISMVAIVRFNIFHSIYNNLPQFIVILFLLIMFLWAKYGIFDSEIRMFIELIK